MERQLGQVLKQNMQDLSMVQPHSYDNLVAAALQLPRDMYEQVHLRALDALKYSVNLPEGTVTVDLDDLGGTGADAKRFNETRKKYAKNMLGLANVNQLTVLDPTGLWQAREISESRMLDLQKEGYDASLAQPMLIAIDDSSEERERLVNENIIKADFAWTIEAFQV